MRKGKATPASLVLGMAKLKKPGEGLSQFEKQLAHAMEVEQQARLHDEAERMRKTLLYGRDLFDDVLAFHKKFGFPIPDMPTPLHRKKAIVKISHALEELAEYDQQCLEKNSKKRRAKELDAIVDAVYVILGIAVLSGYENFNEAWRRVHAANMTKVRATKASQSKRGSTFDVIKPPNFKSPVLEDLV